MPLAAGVLTNRRGRRPREQGSEISHGRQIQLDHRQYGHSDGDQHRRLRHVAGGVRGPAQLVIGMRLSPGEDARSGARATPVQFKFRRSLFDTSRLHIGAE